MVQRAKTEIISKKTKTKGVAGTFMHCHDHSLHMPCIRLDCECYMAPQIQNYSTDSESWPLEVPCLLFLGEVVGFQDGRLERVS